MSTPVQIKGTGDEVARVSRTGELRTTRAKNDTSSYVAVSSTGTAFNLMPPTSLRKIVITGILAVSDKNITADAIVEIYSAENKITTTAAETLFKFAMTKNAVVSMPGILLEVPEGLYISAKTDDATIHITILCYTI